MRSTQFLFALAFSAWACAASAQQPTVFTRADPVLVLVRYDVPNQGLLTEWRGRLRLLGTLVLEFDRGPLEHRELHPDGVALFEPDSASLAKLPAALNNNPLAPTVIGLRRTPADVLSPLLGAKRTRAITQGDKERYEFPAAIWLSSLSTSLDCDRRSFALTFSRIELLKPAMRVAGAAVNLHC